jgi:hypothetical protein
MDLGYLGIFSLSDIKERLSREQAGESESPCETILKIDTLVGPGLSYLYVLNTSVFTTAKR